MSVLKSRRRPSRAIFVVRAYEIETETLNYLSRLSARYSRLLAPETMKLASEVIALCEKANSMRPEDAERYNLRKIYLLQARAVLKALDVSLGRVTDILELNPQGAFTKSNGDTMDKERALEKLNKIRESLGCKIDEEDKMLTKLLETDKRDLKKAQARKKK